MYYTDYSSKWVRSDTEHSGSGIHIRNVVACTAISLGHICIINITATVNGTWLPNDDAPWILGQLPVPKNNSDLPFVGYSKTSGTIRFYISQYGWLKPWYNQTNVNDGTEFSAHVSYITA